MSTNCRSKFLNIFSFPPPPWFTNMLVTVVLINLGRLSLYQLKAGYRAVILCLIYNIQGHINGLTLSLTLIMWNPPLPDTCNFSAHNNNNNNNNNNFGASFEGIICRLWPVQTCFTVVWLNMTLPATQFTLEFVTELCFVLQKFL